MGYTHYMRYDEITNGQWEIIDHDLDLILEVAKEKGIVIKDASGEGDFEKGIDKIMFNGDASKYLDHETFVMERKPAQSFNFCKTARKPYDAVVVACLCSMKQAMGDKIEISSDGDEGDEEWHFGVELFNEATGKSISIKEVLS
jgi:hypothetical protein